MLILLGAAFIIYTVLGFWLVPRLVRSNLVGFASEQYHRTLTVGDIRFNPYNLVLEIRTLSLPDADGHQLLGFERLMLNFDISSVWKFGASFAAVELEQPFARVNVRRDRTLNLLDLTHLANPGPPSASDETPRVDIDRLSVTAGRVAFEDDARARAVCHRAAPDQLRAARFQHRRRQRQRLLAACRLGGGREIRLERSVQDFAADFQRQFRGRLARGAHHLVLPA